GAILFLAIQPTLLNPSLMGITRSLFLGTLLLTASFTISRFGLTRIFGAVANTPELVIITASAWCFAVCLAAEFSGLSKEMGALIAGISIATFPYGIDVANKISGIRDFFVTLFFVSLGLKIPQPTWSILMLSFFATTVVIGTRFLSIVPMSCLMKKGIHTGIVTSLNLSQISEFSLVIVAIGIKFGHVSHDIETLVLSSMLMTSIVSSYLIIFNHRLASFFTTAMELLFPRRTKPAHSMANNLQTDHKNLDIVVLGCFREGRAFLDQIARNAPQLIERVLVIDYNPALGSVLESTGFTWRYGDLSNPNALKHLGLENASVVVCPVSDLFLKGTTNMKLFMNLQSMAPNALFILTAEDNDAHDQLIQQGAYKAVIPGQITGMTLFKILEEALIYPNRNLQ
ncbi:MAG: cation:proton antiporter, partial [Kiritimatiellae bacterium]|nr:cation:proton antiporter [Kiritimatiellia bacterium]